MEHLRHVGPFLARYRIRLLLGVLCALCTSALTSTVPLILGSAVDDLSTRGVLVADLLRYGAILLAIAIGDTVFRFGQRTLIHSTAFLTEFDLREAVFRHLITLDQDFYSGMHTGDLMARATNDLTALRMFLGPGLSSLSSALLTLSVSAFLMVRVNVTLALVVLLLLPVTTVIFVVIGRRTQRLFRRVQDQFGELSTRAQENFSGIRTIKAYAQEEAEIADFRQANERYRGFNERYVLLSGLLWPLIAMTLGLIGAIVLLIGGNMVATGRMSLGDLVLFNGYLGVLAWPMIALGWTVNLYQEASASMGRIAEVLHRKPKVVSPAGAQARLDVAGAIEFRNVGVRFSNDIAAKGAGTRESAAAERWVLRHISFTIPSGSTLAIVGATGAGKTTLVNLLARVRDPDEGQILLDGQDIRHLPLDELRRAIGYVPQDTFLFGLSLRENVAFGRPDAGEEEIERAVSISRLSNDLPQLPKGMDTILGERGVTLSGGQKQRTAIARAILRDPAILVLDDALSSVDVHTAAEILAGLRRTLRGRTGIVIAQRIATVKDADTILVLHDGRIVEQGTHRELIQRGERYSAMYRRELLKAEIEDKEEAHDS